MTILVRTLVKKISAEIAPEIGEHALECRAEIFEDASGRFSIEYSHHPVHTIGERGWALANLTWAHSLIDAEQCVAEYFRALKVSREIKPSFN